MSPVCRLILVLAAALAPATANARPLTLAYGTQGASQTLDLYRPQAGPAPLVIYIHGGGWRWGDKAGGRPAAAALTAMGYVVASMNYRLSSQDGATVADAAADVAHAAAFLLAHAAEYGIDPRRFALAGHSAGGHLAALVATDPAYARAAGLDLSRLAAVVALDGVFDLTRLPQAAGMDPATRQAVSPTFHASQPQGHPLFCLIHETLAPLFGIQADAFAAALRVHGQRVEESLVPVLAHPALAARFNDPAAPMAGETEKCLKEAVLF